MKFPTPEQVELYIKFADAELGPECSEEWVEEIRFAICALASGKAMLVSNITYAWGGGDGSKCRDGCHWEIREVAGDILTEKCSKCGTIRSVCK